MRQITVAQPIRSLSERLGLWKVRYAVWIGRLVLNRRISIRSARSALRTFPIAVAGRGGSYIIDALL